MTVAQTRRKWTLADVRRGLRTVATQSPDDRDPRVARGLPPRYVEHGKPRCLVAGVLFNLGWSLPQIKQLDLEGRRPSGRSVGGVRFADSRNPLVRRIDPLGRALLDYVQGHQDTGYYTWDVIVAKAFQEDADGQRWTLHPRHILPWNTDYKRRNTP